MKLRMSINNCDSIETLEVGKANIVEGTVQLYIALDLNLHIPCIDSDHSIHILDDYGKV